MTTNELLSNELTQLRSSLFKEITNASFLSEPEAASVWICIAPTEYASCTAMFFYPDEYPQKPLIVQLKSKNVSEKLLNGIARLMEEEAVKLVGARQTLATLKLLTKFLDDHLFAVCYHELQTIKSLCESSKCVTLKVKQKTGVLSFTITIPPFTSHVKLRITRNYPLEQVIVDQSQDGFKSDLPTYLTKILINQAVEVARKCVEPPLKINPRDPPFQLQPSLLRVAKFLVFDGIMTYPNSTCLLCNSPIFPNKLADVVNDPKNGMYVERVYCCHLFHYICLHKLITTPPFNTVKKCPACKSPIYHERFRESPQVLQDRWAHKQAKERELDEVVDFLK